MTYRLQELIERVDEPLFRHIVHKEKVPWLCDFLPGTG